MKGRGTVKKIDVHLFSSKYSVRTLDFDDVSSVFELCKKNRDYYDFCPPFVSEQSIFNDMRGLPPGKTLEDKYYVGYFEGGGLLAVLDFIRSFPKEDTAFLGFFMLDKARHNQGLGTEIISELCDYLRKIGCRAIRLGWIEGNRKAAHFWHKNGFIETGVKAREGTQTIVVAEKIL